MRVVVVYCEEGLPLEKGCTMAQQFSAQWAKGIIDDNVKKAQNLIENPDQVNELLEQLQEKLAGLPTTIGNAFTNVPVMADMVKSYVTREYTEVSPKVIASLVAAFIYFVKRDDLISDDIPIVGYVDDLALATVAMAINEPELNAFAEWKATKDNAPIDLVPVEMDGLIEVVDAERSANE